jgi:hypothetical protein
MRLDTKTYQYIIRLNLLRKSKLKINLKKLLKLTYLGSGLKIKILERSSIEGTTNNKTNRENMREEENNR